MKVKCEYIERVRITGTMKEVNEADDYLSRNNYHNRRSCMSSVDEVGKGVGFTNSFEIIAEREMKRGKV